MAVPVRWARLHISWKCFSRTDTVPAQSIRWKTVSLSPAMACTDVCWYAISPLGIRGCLFKSSGGLLAAVENSIQPERNETRTENQYEGVKKMRADKAGAASHCSAAKAIQLWKRYRGGYSRLAYVSHMN